MRPGSRRNAVGLAVDGTHRKPDRALLEGLDVRLHGRADFGGLLREQGGVDDVDHVVGVDPAGHKRERILALHQPYLDINVIDQ